MNVLNPKPRKALRGARIIKTSRGIISFAAVAGASILLAPASATAQAADPLECLPGSTGPAPGDSTPYGGGMCDLGSLRMDDNGFSDAYVVSADGTVVVGRADTDAGNLHAFRWDTGSADMLDLGSLRADDSGFSYAFAVSADGAVVAGIAEADDGNSRAFRWDTGSADMLDLGTLRTDDGGRSAAYAVSADGAVVVGNADTDDGSRHAFRWDTGSADMLDLGTLRTDDSGDSLADAISADGAVVVGRATTDEGTSRAFRWDAGSADMLDLGTLRTDDSGASFAEAVSADGTVVAGYADTDDGVSRAFRWDTDTADMLDLGTLRADDSGTSHAYTVSADGAVVVGSADTDDGTSRAFRWDAGSADMLDLGTLRADDSGTSAAYAVSADGAVVVGHADTDDGTSRAFRWDTDTADMLDLGTLRTDDSGSSMARAVSADGAVVVGRADTDDGTARAFIWRTEMQDFENLIESFPVLANDTEIAVAQQQSVIGRFMDATCTADTDQICMNVGGWLANSDRRTSGVTTFSFGRGMTDQVVLGGTLSLNGTNLSANGFDMGNAIGTSLWAEYSQGRTGWQASGAIGWGREKGDISRGRGMEDVMRATGKSDLTTTAAMATLGYGFQQQNWIITPSVALAHYSTKRSGYSETGADFNASYNALSLERTAATTAVSGEYRLSEQDTFSLGAGVEHDFSADRAILTGTSTLPGMDTFSVASTLERRKTRGFLDVGYIHDLGNNSTISESLRVGQSTYGSAPQVGVGINYATRF